MLQTCWENNGDRVSFSWRKIFFLVAGAKHNIAVYVFHKAENVSDPDEVKSHLFLLYLSSAHICT